ncbi:hypothetical protein QN277_019435 [Acacia crassicarpa]|uniref:Uncharacterized protein n=1 Tax=Acacia crassicarpa TaxID=499986 RepID=A0AAE1MRU0_9FABA|nr:hypothetical protein QN277_019435 [Acacia crassicarpa]
MVGNLRPLPRRRLNLARRIIPSLIPSAKTIHPSTPATSPFKNLVVRNSLVAAGSVFVGVNILSGCLALGGCVHFGMF